MRGGGMTVRWKLIMLWLFAANSIIQTTDGDPLEERPTAVDNQPDIGNEVEESSVYIYICNGPKSNTTYKDCQITRDPDVCYHVGTLSMYRSCTDLCNDVEQHSEEEDTCRRYSQCGVYLRENCQLTLKNPPTTAAAAAPAPTTESAVGKTAEEGKEQSAAVAKYEKVVPDINEESVDNGRVGLMGETTAIIVVVAVILVAIVMAVVIHKKRSQRNGPQPDPNPIMEMQDLGGGQNDAVVIDVPIVAPQQPEVGPENMETEPFLRDNHGVQNTDTNDCGSGRPMPMETNRRKSF